MKNHFQAVKGEALAVVPSTWPNRAIRRAVRYARALPTEWAVFFADKPQLITLIKTGRLA